jgi:threonine/homoserine/homoserine lactone efflux protein
LSTFIETYQVPIGSFNPYAALLSFSMSTLIHDSTMSNPLKIFGVQVLLWLGCHASNKVDWLSQ